MTTACQRLDTVPIIIVCAFERGIVSNSFILRQFLQIELLGLLVEQLVLFHINRSMSSSLKFTVNTDQSITQAVGSTPQLIYLRFFESFFCFYSVSQENVLFYGAVNIGAQRPVRNSEFIQENLYTSEDILVVQGCFLVQLQ